MKRWLFACALACATFAPTGALAGQAYHPVWRLCVRHLDFATERTILRSVCHTYTLTKETRRPVGVSHRVIRSSPHIIKDIRFPTFAPVVQPVQGLQESWEVTYYTLSGTMADGAGVRWGAAACGYDVALGTRIIVPGVGLLVCEDREGPTGNPWHHVDVWGYHPGLGNDYRTVTVLR